MAPGGAVMEQTKQCTKCGEVKPVSAYYGHPKGRYGVKPECKACSYAMKQAYLHNPANRTKVQAQRRAARERALTRLSGASLSDTRVCTGCGEVKPLSAYSPLMSVCKPCNSARASHYRDNNPEYRQRQNERYSAMVKRLAELEAELARLREVR